MIGIFDYIKEQSDASIDQIYGNSVNDSSTKWACRAVFQHFSQLSKNYIMRMLFLNTEVLVSDIQYWVNEDALDNLNESLVEMKQLRILLFATKMQQTSKGPVEANYVRMNPHFRKNFVASLTSSSQPWERENEVNHDSIINTDYLDAYFNKAWEKMLYYLINGELALPGNAVMRTMEVPAIVDNFLVYTGLLRRDPEHGETDTRRSITRKGYEFMLLDRYSQVWGA